MLNCTCEANANNFSDQQITKDSNLFLSKFYQNCRSNKINKSIKSEKFYIFKDSSTLRKQIYEINNANYLSYIKYFEYYKKKYYKIKYFNKYK